MTGGTCGAACLAGRARGAGLADSEDEWLGGIDVFHLIMNMSSKRNVMRSSGSRMVRLSVAVSVVLSALAAVRGAPLGPIDPKSLPDFTRSVHLDGLNSVPKGVAEGESRGPAVGSSARDDQGEAFPSVPSGRRLRSDTAVADVTAADSSQCTIEENVAYVGATLANADGTSMRIKGVQSAADCCGQCACIDGCLAWSWSKTTKICYPKSGSGYTRDPMRSGIYSGAIIDPKVKYYAKGTKIWQPSLTVGEHALKSFGKDTSTNDRANNKHVVKDPTCSSDEPVVRAIYQEGRWSPGQGEGGGVLFFAWPNGKDVSLGDTVRLEYEVYFPENFEWVKGGKLPGIIGGKTGCGGGDDADDCFSVRVMWRRDGDGEAYIYTRKDTWTPEICDTQGTHCDSNAGMSFMRGAFRFERERWTKVAITVSMNDVGEANGYVRLDLDGETKVEGDKFTFRSSKDVYPEAFTFSTWYGGSDVTWSPSTTVEAYFRNFKLYRLNA